MSELKEIIKTQSKDLHGVLAQHYKDKPAELVTLLMDKERMKGDYIKTKPPSPELIAAAKAYHAAAELQKTLSDPSPNKTKVLNNFQRQFNKTKSDLECGGSRAKRFVTKIKSLLNLHKKPMSPSHSHGLFKETSTKNIEDLKDKIETKKMKIR